MIVYPDIAVLIVNYLKAESFELMYPNVYNYELPGDVRTVKLYNIECKQLVSLRGTCRAFRAAISLQFICENSDYSLYRDKIIHILDKVQTSPSWLLLLNQIKELSSHNSDFSSNGYNSDNYQSYTDFNSLYPQMIITGEKIGMMKCMAMGSIDIIWPSQMPFIYARGFRDEHYIYTNDKKRDTSSRNNKLIIPKRAPAKHRASRAHVAKQDKIAKAQRRPALKYKKSYR